MLENLEISLENDVILIDRKTQNEEVIIYKET